MSVNKGLEVIMGIFIFSSNVELGHLQHTAAYLETVTVSAEFNGVLNYSSKPRSLF